MKISLFLLLKIELLKTVILKSFCRLLWWACQLLVHLPFCIPRLHRNSLLCCPVIAVVYRQPELRVLLLKAHSCSPTLYISDTNKHVARVRLCNMLNSTSLYFQRVMPSSFFVLLRFFLRVDGVLIRMNDTRLHHEVSPHSPLWLFYRCSLAILLSEKNCWYSCTSVLMLWGIEVTQTELSD